MHTQQIEITNTLFISPGGELIDAQNGCAPANGINWVTRMKALQKATQAQLAFMMGMAPDDYICYKIKLLLNWMIDVLDNAGYPDAETSAYEYIQRKEILGWWKNDWAQEDEKLIAMNLICKNKNVAKAFAINYHIERVSPDGFSYDDLRKQFFKLI